ncbi:chromosome partitioning protein ParA [Vibrio sp. TRT 21S02]|uniref:chromosome partitioning protein ParA n=1 Tax=Vibrio sp. TRT 21S02 TaxID=3418507 RepID=UPI003CFAF898
MKRMLCVVALLVAMIGCKDSSSDETATVPIPIEGIEKTPELVEKLRAQPTIDAQFGVLYDQFEHMLDRSDSLTGPDTNNDGIRDDIEFFINALEVTEPVRNALKQNARQAQENLYYDFSEKTPENRKKAQRIGDKYLKVVACKTFVGMSINDRVRTGEILRALTYNTKVRTLAFIAYNHLQDGSVSTLLEAEQQHCEE